MHLAQRVVAVLGADGDVEYRHAGVCLDFEDVWFADCNHIRIGCDGIIAASNAEEILHLDLKNKVFAEIFIYFQKHEAEVRIAVGVIKDPWHGAEALILM